MYQTKKNVELQNIKVQNFKSFQNIDLTFGDLNVIIGANASGKSNFVQIFNFLSDIRKHGLDNAISLQGGIEFVRNFKIGANANIIFEIKVRFPRPVFLRYPLRRNMGRIQIKSFTYRFEIKPGKRSGYKIVNDKATLGVQVNLREPGIGQKSFTSQKSFDGELILSNENNRIKLTNNFSENMDVKLRSLDFLFHRDRIPSKSLLLETFEFRYFLEPQVMDFLDEMAIYDFDPKLAKRAVPLRGKVELENDGSNLAVVLKNVLENRDSRRKLSNLLSYLLPFVDSINIEKFADKSILFKLKETYYKNQTLPSSLISDGTINITALILALYFQDNKITFIEEPERNIHPSLMIKIIELMKEASQIGQIMVTTHNPELVRYAGIENIFLVSRDSDGFSNIIRPSEVEEVRDFLKNDMEIGELYIQNLLGD